MIDKPSGFTLIEIMITLLLGVLISGAIIQVLASNSVTEKLNRAVSSAQENGRFITSRMRSDLLMTGRYDPLSEKLNTDVDIVSEAAFVSNHPVFIPGDFNVNPTLGSIQGNSGASDTLVVGLQGSRDCRGYALGYPDEQEFHVINEYFVDGTQFKCRGFDGRVLRGLKSAQGNNGDAAFTLLDDVYSFQVTYGITESADPANNARPVRFVDASQLANVLSTGNQVVSLRISFLLWGDGDVAIDPIPSFRLLNEAAITPTDSKLYKQFDVTISLRNVKNHVRSNSV